MGLLMMNKNKFKIESIRIYNFKVFENWTIDFKNTKLITLGGPNGYGKTSIFDAIELALTGNIARFMKIDTATGNQDNLVARDTNKRVAIQLILFNNQKKVIIKRELIELSDRKVDNKTSNFSNLWKLVLSEDGESRDIKQKELEELLGETNLKKYYNNFFYIQQEDTAHFFRKDEKKRLEEISKLFDIGKEEKELKKVGDFRKKINDIKNNKENEKEKLSKGIDISTDRSNSLEYKKILTWIASPKLLDKESIIFNDENSKFKYLSELDNIKLLIEWKDTVFKFYKIHYLKEKREIIKALLVGYNFWKRYDNLITNANEKKILQNILEKFDIIDNFLNKKIDLSFFKDKIDFNFDEFKNDLEQLILDKKNLSNSNDILVKLIDVRNSFVKNFKKSDLDDNECPLCGTDFTEEQMNLFDAIDVKEKFLKSLLESDTKKYTNALTVFEIKRDKLKELINTSLNDEKYLFSNEYIDFFKKYKQYEKSTIRFYQFLFQLGIDMSKFVLSDITEKIDEDKLNGLVNNIIELIDEKNQFPEEFMENGNSLISIYKEYFQNNENNVNLISKEDIDSKKLYVEYQYYKFNKNKQLKIEKLKKEIDKLIDLVKSLSILETIYRTKIAEHRQKIIKDIEIPFYIYSGKILQSIRDNNATGVYIKDSVRNGDKLNNLRFVSKWDSDQDIINTTSSGQLAGIVIALTLALNRVYSKGFGTILIDDPVQSMDDINMISLMELLRNDFKDKQIFISTHEDSIEKYILYKFIKSNQSVCRVDVMNRDVYHKETTPLPLNLHFL
jgi:exonuclease SbcC